MGRVFVGMSLVRGWVETFGAVEEVQEIETCSVLVGHKAWREGQTVDGRGCLPFVRLRSSSRPGLSDRQPADG